MSPRRTGGARRLLGAFLLCCPALAVGASQPAAAADALLAVEPAEGKSDWGNIRLVTNRGCPEKTTNLIVEIVGANFPPGSFAVGNSELSGFPTASNGEGLVIPLFGSWDTLAEANGGKRILDGTAELTLICIDQGAEKALDRITGAVEFSKSSSGPSAYEQAEGPRLVSGFPYKASDVVPFVYRYDLPPGSPGGPPIGGPTEPPGLTAANAAFATADGPPGEDPEGDGGDVAAADDQKDDQEASSSGTTDATQVTRSDRNSGPSSTALVVGLVVLAGAATTGYVVYERARRYPPAEL